MEYIAVIESACWSGSEIVNADCLDSAKAVVKDMICENDKWFAEKMAKGKMRHYEYHVTISGKEDTNRHERWDGVMQQG